MTRAAAGDRTQLLRSMHRNVIAGLAVITLLIGGIGLWLGTAKLSGAVVASGKLVVESNVKKVQHPEGGIVGELLIKEGDRVEAGQVLMRLDATQTRASLAIVQHAMDELSATKVRLEGERDGLDELTFPDDLTARKDEPHVVRILDGEKRLFELRRSSREGEKSQLRERIDQLENEIVGLTEQVEAKNDEIALIREELVGVRKLWEKDLVQISRLNALEREAARLEGERGQLTAAIAQAKGKIAEVELQIIQIDQNLRTEVGMQLAEIRAKLSEYRERKITAEDKLKRIDIRAPQTGKVHQLAVHTVGGVIAPGDPVMLIVPAADSLLVEARVSPADIDQLHPDQTAVLRFSAFERTQTPELRGSVSYISADLTEDRRTGESYYVTRIAISDAELDKLNGLALVPGMPVEAFIETKPRTVLSYLIKPLKDQFARAFRET